MIKLYGYWRSTAAYRVRIALNIKGLDYEQCSVHLVKEGGEQHKEAYRSLNPQGLVPLLVHDDVQIHQSQAILEYLEERFPEKTSLLPAAVEEKAQVRALCNEIACDIHPLNNLRVLNYLTQNLSVDDEHKMQWYHHWIKEGFTAIEMRLAKHAGGEEKHFCWGEEVSLADVLLIPQVYNAKRFNVDLTAFPYICAINDHCLTLKPFQEAMPENQSDAS